MSGRRCDALRQALERQDYCHPRGVHARHAEPLRDFAQTPLDLDAGHHHLATARFEARQRQTVAVVRFGLDGALERRGGVRRVLLWELHRMPADPAHFVANSIDDRLAETGLHRAHMAGLEHIQAPERVKRRFLHEVAGVERSARGGRELAVRPPFERWKAPLQQRLDRGPVAGACPDDQLECWFVAAERAREVLGRRWSLPRCAIRDGRLALQP